jgi:protein SCO1/2
MSNQAGSNKINAERLFLYIAIIIPVLIATGFFFLLVALNKQSDSQNFSSENSDAVVMAPDHPRQLVNFSLIDRTGRTVTRSEFAGKFLIVDFLFTSCSLTCPIVNHQMAQIQHLTTNQPDVELVSLTVNPRDDTTDVLEKYSERFSADTNRWLFLTGEKDVLYNLIAKSFLRQDLDDPFNYMPGNFSHTERIAIVDTHGNLCGYFDGLNQNTASAVINEINKLRNKNL